MLRAAKAYANLQDIELCVVILIDDLILPLNRLVGEKVPKQDYNMEVILDITH